MNEIQIESAGQISETQLLNWNKVDTVWMLSLFGTAIGAGVLFLPITAGAGGLLPLLIITVLAFPMTYLAHRAMSRFVLSSQNNDQDITGVAKEHFGTKAGSLVTFFYFFAIFPILLMYSVAITNTSESFIIHQLGMSAPPRALLSAVILGALLAIITFGQNMVVKAMSTLVYPFIISLLLLSLYLIPHWNLGFWTESLLIKRPEFSNSTALLNSLWLLIPLMVFSFNHSPIISSFSLSQRQRYGQDADYKTGLILRNSHILMIVMVMFFVFSCVFSLTPEDLAMARKQNISILSYLANHFQTPLIAYAVPVIAFVAISKSFLGHYLGAREGLQGLWKSAESTISTERSGINIIDWTMISVCWIVATLNPSILGMIETLGGPVIAIILFLLPIYAIYRLPSLKHFQSPMRDGFVVLIGLIALSARLYSMIF